MIVLCRALIPSSYTLVRSPSLVKRVATAYAATPTAPQQQVLGHIKKLDCFGQFLVRVTCGCGASRHIEPEALARLAGWSTTLKALAPRPRCSQCGKKAAEVVAVARPRPRGVPKNPH